MGRVYLFLNTAFFFWSLSLVAWCYDAYSWALLTAALAIIAFVIHALHKQVNHMFGKNKAVEEVTHAPVVNATPTPVAEKEVPRDEKQNSTVIATGVRFDGNIISSGQVYIYGTVHGNIDAKEGLIKIMRNGVVEGDITSRDLIIDGIVNGNCRSESIDVYENGAITGTIAYSSLTIKKGASFTGRSELIRPVEEKSNVVGLLAETAPEVLPVAESENEAKGKKRS
ncbi:MAG TPA: polymer-forming cytoskeletal protein [Enterobacteriaceae bacterium]|nr:polymer-forming cytoskeletal protein [Enterobacteriaceae bacterium]